MEKTPLTAPVLYPSRMDSDALQIVEKLMAGLILLLGVASAIYCCIMGMKYHPEHLVLAVILVVCIIEFMLMARLYKNDILQDRKVVYLSGLIVLMIACVGFMYGAAWVPVSSSSFHGCPAQNFYSSAKRNSSTSQYGGGTCMQYTLPPPVASSSQCAVISNVTTPSWLVSPMALPLNSSLLTCTTVTAALSRCYNQTAPLRIQGCPAPSPPSPSPSPSP